MTQAVSLLEEVVTPRKELPPLLLKLSERRAERLDYLGVSYGLTAQLLRLAFFSMKSRTLNILKTNSFFILNRFWKKAGYSPVYLRQTPVGLIPY